MKKIVFGLTLALAALSINAEAKTPKTTEAVKWTADVVHSSVKFTVTHMKISDVEGRFKVFNGDLAANGTDFNNATVNFSVDASSINTDNDGRDTHVKGPDFLEVDKNPTITFASTSFKKVSGSAYTLEGNMTMHGVTKKVKFAVIYGGEAKDPYGNTKAGFRASGKINRNDFGVGAKFGDAMLSSDIAILLNLEFTKAK